MVAKANASPVPSSVWQRPKAAPHQPALSRALIVREAIALLDATGAEALSMRNLGARLNAGATSMYRHVATKDELMELAVDEVLGEVTVPAEAAEGGPDWRASTTACVGSFRATAVRHPWLCAELGRAGLAYLGPNLSAISERLALVFTNAGFPDPHTVIDVVFSYAIGMSTTESAWLTTVARAGQTEAEFLADLRTATQRAAAESEQPQDAGSGTGVLDPVAFRDDKFDRGLAMVLDGLAAQLPH